MIADNPHICARCAAAGRTCCELSGGDEEFCFPLSGAEMDRIRAAGHATASFVPAPNTPAFVEQLGALMPDLDVAAAFPETDAHWRLATDTDGRCVFLGATGCVLPRDIRPRYCRMFPLWPYADQLTWFTAEECLANRECPSLRAMLQAMQLTSAEVETLFAAMCAELGLTALNE